MRNNANKSGIFLWLIFPTILLLMLGLCFGYGLLTIVSVEKAMVLLLGVLVFLWFWYDIRIGLCLTLFSMLGGQLLRFSLGTGGVLVSDVFMGVLAIVWLIYLGFQAKKVTWNVVLMFMAIFIFVILLTNIRASYDFHTGSLATMWLYWFRLLLYSSFLPITWSVVSWYPDNLKYLQWLIWSGVLLLILGFIQLIYFPNIIFMAQYGWDPHIGRLLSTFLDPNFVGALLVFVVAISYSFFLQIAEWKVGKWLWLVITLLLVLGVVLTYSRSAYVALVVVFVILSWWKDKRLLLLGIVAGLLMFFGDARVMERIDGMFTVDETAQKRIVSWENSLEIVDDNVFYGIGYNNMLSENMRRGYVKDAMLHSAAGSDSSYLTVWTTMGIAGLITYFLFWIVVVAVLMWMHIREKKDKIKKWLVLGVAVGIIGVMIHAQFTNSLLYNHIYMVILFAVGLCMGWQPLETKNKKR